MSFHRSTNADLKVGSCTNADNAVKNVFFCVVFKYILFSESVAADKRNRRIFSKNVFLLFILFAQIFYWNSASENIFVRYPSTRVGTSRFSLIMSFPGDTGIPACRNWQTLSQNECSCVVKFWREIKNNANVCASSRRIPSKMAYLIL